MEGHVIPTLHGYICPQSTHADYKHDAARQSKCPNTTWKHKQCKINLKHIILWIPTT